MHAPRDPHAYLSQFHWSEAEHKTWNSSFDEHVRCAQIDEDLLAARTVTALLIAIVGGGAILGALGVTLSMLFAS